MKILNSKGKEVILPFYHIELLSKSVRPYEMTIEEIIPKNSIDSIYLKTAKGKHVLMIEWLVQIDDPFERWKMVHKLSEELRQCTIQFELELEAYECILKSIDYDSINHYNKIVKMEFACAIYGPMKTIALRNQKTILTIDGARTTYISFEIQAMEDLNDLMINDILIKRMSKGDMLKIDSEKKTIMKNDVSDFKNVELTWFPEAVGTYEIIVNTLASASIKCCYKARW